MASYLEKSVEEQSKYLFYFVALNFTFLAAAINSAELSTYSGATYTIEIGGWLSLLMSGFFVLRAIEGRSDYFMSMYKSQTGDIKETPATFGDLSNHEIHTEAKKQQLDRRYVLGRFFFMFGVCLIVTARAVDGL